MNTSVCCVGMLVLVVICAPVAAWGAAGEPIVASPVSDRAERVGRFAERNSAAGQERLARELAEAIDLESPGVKEGFGRLYREGRFEEALAAYRDYVVAKLRNPAQYGIPALCVEPTSPDPQHAPFDSNLQQSPAEELMRNIVTVRDLKVDVGQPGAINWTFIPPGWEAKPLPAGTLTGSDDNTGDIPWTPANETWQARPAYFGRRFRQPSCFNTLLQAYVTTGDKAYLEKWAEYMDDWCMNQKRDADNSPYNVQLYRPQEIQMFTAFIGNLAFVANSQPGFAQDLPPETLVRFLLRRLPESAAASMRQLRCFESNWRYLMSRWLVCNGLLFREFHFSEAMMKEGQRGVEIANVDCMLPDGTDYEDTPNYWGTYLMWATLPFYQLAQPGVDPGLDKDFLANLQEHSRLRARAELGQLMPSGRWPILGPQDLRTQLPEYDCGAFWEAIPDFFDVPDNARRLNRAFKGQGPSYRATTFGDGSTALPSYTSEWFPYGGMYFLRAGWDPNDAFAFMKSAANVICHGSSLSHWQNENVASFYDFGQELLFVHHVTPVTVDGYEQNMRFGLPYSGHLGYILPKRVQPEPMPARWHCSDTFDVAEGIYDGNYAADPGEHALACLLGQAPQPQVADVVHRRQILFVKPLGLWVVTDRMESKVEHQYGQLWLMHISESSDYGDIYGFAADQIQVDAANGVLRTSNPAGPNLSLYQIASAPLSIEVTPAPPNPIGVHTWTKSGRDERYLEGENYLFSPSISRVITTWRGQGEQILISLIVPRKTMDDNVASMHRAEGEGSLGFDLALKDGSSVSYRVAPDCPSPLSGGGIAARGEALLTLRDANGGERGIALGCERLSYRGRKEELPVPDVEFACGERGQVAMTPIYRPIEPVKILPDVSGFMNEVKVTMSTGTPGVNIHYTLDGSEPTPRSPAFIRPITLTESATVKARAFRPGVREVPPTLSGTQATLVVSARFTKQEPKKAATPTGKLVPGLAFEYYDGPWQDLWLRLDDLQPVARGHVTEVPDIGAALPGRYFAFRYKGWFEAPADGVYTFYSPEPTFASGQLHLEAGYDLRVAIDSEAWQPGTRRHAFGSWSVALKKGMHRIEVTYMDFRRGKEDMYFPNQEYGCVWSGEKPPLLMSGPGMERQALPANLLWREEE